MNFEVSWTELKAQIAAKNVNYSHVVEPETGNILVWISDGANSMSSYLNNAGQVTDFNTNYLAGSNNPHVQRVEGVVKFSGFWNAATNSPSLSNGSGKTGQYYVVSTGGTTTIDGINLWDADDIIICHDTGDPWRKITRSAKGIIYDNSGSTLIATNVADAIDELDAKVNSATAADYVHTQASAASTWNIAHNLGYFPNVAAVDSAETVFHPEVEYIDSNNITLRFKSRGMPINISGKAYLS